MLVFLFLTYPSSMPMFCLPLPCLSDCPQTPRLTPCHPSPHASPWIDTRTASTPFSPACLLPTPSLSSEKHLTGCSVQIPCGSRSTIFPPALTLSGDLGGRGGRIGYKKRIEQDRNKGQTSEALTSSTALNGSPRNLVIKMNNVSVQYF